MALIRILVYSIQLVMIGGQLSFAGHQIWPGGICLRITANENMVS